MKPVIAVSLGDPAGVGPEVVLKAVNSREIEDCCEIVVYGSGAVLAATCSTLSLTMPRRIIDDGQLSKVVPTGEINSEAGSAAIRWVREAAAAVMEGTADALVTAPINKEAAALGGSTFPGHTELLADLAGCRDVSMMLVSGNLRVIHVSTHVSLRSALDAISVSSVSKTIESAIKGCSLLEIDSPLVAVAGVNPHAGEGGKFGLEECNILAPAIAACRMRGWRVVGPEAPDIVFARAVKGEFDIVVAMYHDQGHIPVKLSGFDRGVNVTVGLPFIRTSPDHGTAFDIAGRGVARPNSMIAAILLAVEMVKRRG